MTVRKLHLFPDPLLNHPSKPIVDFGQPLLHLIQDLQDTLYSTLGVGLAAPQIGVSERVSIIDVRRKKPVKKQPVYPSHGLIVLINPALQEGRGTQIFREGCLSLPDYLANVKRFEKVTVRTFNLSGKEFMISSEGFEALALQHEIDHLNGTLFIDRVANLQTDIFRRSTY